MRFKALALAAVVAAAGSAFAAPAVVTHETTTVTRPVVVTHHHRVRHVHRVVPVVHPMRHVRRVEFGRHGRGLHLARGHHKAGHVVVTRKTIVHHG